MAAQVLTWAVTLATVRLLTPVDYGLSGLATGVTAVLITFVDLGLLIALPAMPAQRRRVLGMAFGLVSLVSFATAASVIGVAPILAQLLGHKELTPLLRLAGVLVLLEGVRAVPSAVALRDFKFTLVARTDFLRAMTQSGTTLLFAWAGGGAWSIIGGSVVGAMISLGPLLRGVRLFPRWPDIVTIRPILQYSRLMLANRMSWQMWVNADTFVIGRLISAGGVGSFNVSRTFAALPMEKLLVVLLGVVAPYLAEHTDDRASLRAYFLDLTELIGLLAGVPLVGMILVAPEALPLIVGPQWSDVPVLLRLLAPGAFIACLGMLANQLVNARGRAAVASQASASAALLALPLYAIGAILGGVAGVAVMTTVVLSIVYVPGIVTALRDTGSSVTQYAHSFRSFGLTAVAMTIVVTGTRAFIASPVASSTTGSWLLVAVLIGSGGIAAFITIWMSGGSGVERLRQIFRDRQRHQSAEPSRSS
jgi:O-antigen/teichoic acid export membrane protein